MSSCCSSLCPRSPPRGTKRRRLVQRFRDWMSPAFACLWPSTRGHSRSSAEEMEQVFHRSDDAFPVGSGQFRHGDGRHHHGWPGNGKKSMSGLREACTLWTPRAGTRHTLMDMMAPTFQFSSISYAAKFLSYMGDFTTVPQFLERTFSGPSAMASSTVNWSNILAHLDGPSHIPLQLKLKVADVQITLSQAGQERHLHITLAQLLGPEPGNEEAHELEPAPAPAPLAAAGPAQEPESPDVKTLLSFSPKLLARQLTRMDAELFQKVSLLDFRGSVWTQRLKWGKENMAPAIRASLAHYGRVVTVVVGTCLGDHRMKAPDRARVLEHWVMVAKECQALNNFSSLHAILRALESTPILRLQRTWAEVSSKSYQTFCELRAKKQATYQDPIIEPVVPYLAKILIDMALLDTATCDCVDGNVNLQKKEKEVEKLNEVQRLQLAANQFHIEPEERFVVWFQAMLQLSMDDSYALSCRLEPPH